MAGHLEVVLDKRGVVIAATAQIDRFGLPGAVHDPQQVAGEHVTGLGAGVCLIRNRGFQRIEGERRAGPRRSVLVIARRIETEFDKNL